MFTTVLVFIFGLIIGSFINVCIYRVPRNISIIAPASSCPNCGRRLTHFELIPVINFILQKGRCKGCGGSISIQYPLVEILTAILFVTGFYSSAGNVLPTTLFIIFLAVTVSFIDAGFKMIPNRLIIAGICWWIIDLFFIHTITWKESLTGFIAGVSTLSAIMLLSRGGIGMGDVKLAGVYGLFLGAPLTGLMLFLGSLLGAVVGVGMVVCGRWKLKDPIAFGPFLSAGAVVSLLWGDAFLRCYLNLF